jgi:hypothetical protein
VKWFVDHVSMAVETQQWTETAFCVRSVPQKTQQWKETEFSVWSASELHKEVRDDVKGTKYPGVKLGHPVPGVINKGTWPSRLGESRMRQ